MAGRQDRSFELIAYFRGGYAAGWYMAVGECFKDELDIKFTERVEAGKKVMRWTQGPYFSFKEGHHIYDTPKAYLQWNEALKYIKLQCEIIRGTPNGISEKGRFVNGWVTFKLSKPNNDRTGLETIGQYDLTQNEFVKFLKTGQLDKGKKS